MNPHGVERTCCNIAGTHNCSRNQQVVKSYCPRDCGGGRLTQKYACGGKAVNNGALGNLIASNKTFH